MIDDRELVGEVETNKFPYYCKKCKEMIEFKGFPIICPKCKKLLIKKDFTGMTGEYLVAAELIARNMFAQVTFGNMKKMDLLVNYQDSEHKERFKIVEVKTKQQGDFYWIREIPYNDKSRVVVFVDLTGKMLSEKPDYYVLNSGDILENILLQVEYYIEKMKSSTRTLTNPASMFFKDHSECKLKCKDEKGRLNFIAEGEFHSLYFGYVDKKTGKIYCLNENSKTEEDFKNSGWGYYTELLQKYKNKWNKIRE